MYARLTRREVHTYFADGARLWEKIADEWDIVDLERVQSIAKDLIKRAGYGGNMPALVKELAHVLQANHG